ncbi:protein kinase domain-containing protein [Streptomyces sp. NRRL WC-3742]|uniref:serine/threonine-protein kinase n=1 Tax=Streptomyces sp. NRRL WC-3742 TaxID=1463934 RepID=UPI00068DEC01|nr:serine/threonine-protein kinase [Streptomyces sp. NRRL WC-3742]
MLQPLPPDQRRLIGPYLTLARLGAGGMGEVYLARSTASDRATGALTGAVAGAVAGAVTGAVAEVVAGVVAVKTLLPEAGPDEELRLRFRREIDSARAVATVLPGTLVACDPDAEPPWLASEFIPGPTLAEAVETTGPLPEASVRALGAELAAALRAVHAQRLLHRDLKPGNVLLSGLGPRLIDFGIAKPLDGTVLTAMGQVIGTPGYMSPEHLDAAAELGPASEVFCLASVLAYAAAGRGPFDGGQTRAVLYRISRAEADLSGVPVGLRAVLARCLSLRPEARPGLDELIAALAPDPGACGWPPAVEALCVRYEQDAAHLASLPVALPAAAPGRRARRGVLAGVAGAALALSLVGALLVPRWLADGAPADGASTGGGSPAPPASTAPAAVAAPPSASQALVQAGGDLAASGEFGAAALDASAVPTGWKPWTRQLGVRLGGCALGGGLFVCSRHDGGLVALDADDGTTRWSLDPHMPLHGRLGDASVRAPVLADGNAYTTDGTYTRAVRLSDHAVVWEKPVRSGWIAGGVTLLWGTVVTETADPASPHLGGSGEKDHGELRGNAAVDGREQWTTPVDSAGVAPIVLGEKLYAVSGRRLETVDVRDGQVSAATAADCTGLHGYGQWVICTGDGRITAFDRQLAGGARPLATGTGLHLALGARGLLVVDGMQHGSYMAVDVAGGRLVWSYQKPENQISPTTGLLLAGDRVVELTAASPGTIDLSQGANAVPRPVSPGAAGWPGGRDGGGVSAGAPSAVLAGGLLYTGFADGTVQSDFAPR